MQYVGDLPQPTVEDLARWEQERIEYERQAKETQERRQAEYRAGVKQSLADAQRMVEATLKPDVDPVVKGIIIAAVTGLLSLQYITLFPPPMLAMPASGSISGNIADHGF